MFDYILTLAIRLGATTIILGWLLSVLGILNFWGYLFIGLPAVFVVLVLSSPRGKAQTRVSFIRCVFLWWKRRRLLPLIFLFTFLLIVCGSVLYEPNNFDGLTVRIPRVLYWMGQHHWYWIKTPFPELNYLLPNYEWLTVPIFLGHRRIPCRRRHQLDFIPFFALAVFHLAPCIRHAATTGLGLDVDFPVRLFDCHTGRQH